MRDPSPTTPTLTIAPTAASDPSPGPTRAPEAAAAATATSSLEAGTVSMLARARALESQGRSVNPVLAAAYRRRAAELRFEAWLRAVRLSPTADIEQFASVAA